MNTILSSLFFGSFEWTGKKMINKVGIPWTTLVHIQTTLLNLIKEPSCASFVIHRSTKWLLHFCSSHTLKFNTKLKSELHVYPFGNSRCLSGEWFFLKGGIKCSSCWDFGFHCYKGMVKSSYSLFTMHCLK